MPSKHDARSNGEAHEQLYSIRICTIIANGLSRIALSNFYTMRQFLSQKPKSKWCVKYFPQPLIMLSVADFFACRMMQEKFFCDFFCNVGPGLVPALAGLSATHKGRPYI